MVTTTDAIPIPMSPLCWFSFAYGPLGWSRLLRLKPSSESFLCEIAYSLKKISSSYHNWKLRSRLKYCRKMSTVDAG